MKVVFINPTKQIRKTVKILSEEFSSDGHDVKILAPSGFSYSPESGIDTVTYPAWFIPGIRYTLPSPRFLFLLRRHITTADAIIAVSCIYIPTVLSVLMARAKGTPSILTVDALPGEEWKYGNYVVDTVATVYTKTFGRIALKLADEVVGLGDYIKEDLYNLIGNQPTIIPNGVDVDRFHPRYEKESNEDVVNLLYVGRLDPVKRVDLLLQTIQILGSDVDKEYHLTIVGEGTKFEQYKDMAASLGLGDKISFEGWVDHGLLNKYYNRSDIFVLSSRSEGQPSVLLEAQSAGVPVVAPKTGGIAELVYAGRLTDTNNPREIASAIRDLVESDETAPIEAAREWVVENYSARTMAERYIQLLERNGVDSSIDREM
nr:glycosyltransferase family 4 protein [Halovivax limisalsi]